MPDRKESRRERRQRQRSEAKGQSSSSLLQRLSGISITKKIIAATGIAVVVGVSAFGAYAAFSVNPDYTPLESTAESIDAVAEGPIYQDILKTRAARTDYVAHLSTSMPELVKAIQEGWLQGVFYDPDKVELEGIITQYLTNRGGVQGSDTFQSEFNSIVTYHNNNRNRDFVGTTTEFPGGNEHYSPLFVFPRAFDSDKIVRDKDFRNTVRHTLQQIKDSYFGISYDGEQIEAEKLTLNFLTRLYQLRGTTAELSHILTHPEESFSFDYTILTLGQFIHRRDNLCPSNDYEQKIKNKQLEDTPFTVSADRDTLSSSHKYLPNKIALPYIFFEAIVACPE